MCGIYGYCSKCTDFKESDLEQEYQTIQVRGPDNTIVKRVSPEVLEVFHGLWIMPCSDAGHQPMQHPKNDKLWLMCNGEIYNHADLTRENKFPVESDSDCEVILWMYEKYGFEKTLQQLDGVFAIFLYDDETKTLNLARDPFGVRFMYYGTTEDKKRIGVASLLKGLSKSFDCVRQFPPSHYTIVDMNQETYDPVLHSYFTIRDITPPSFVKGEELYLREIADALEGAVEKRMMSHREIGCLVSGGVDSSLIAALVNKSFKRRFPDKRMKTFSIGMAHGTDLGKKNKSFFGATLQRPVPLQLSKTNLTNITTFFSRKSTCCC